MFDRTILMPLRSGSTRVTETRTVHEHRAPTDASVKLLSEMEEAARRRIVERYVSEAGDNTLGAVEVWEQMDDMKRHVAFKLNGQTVHVKVSARRDANAMVEELAREITAAIAHMVVRRKL